MTVKLNTMPPCFAAWAACVILLDMQVYRFIILLLLTIFLADTVMASANLHLPAASSSRMQADAHQQHAHHDTMQHDDAQQQHENSCRNCHDCLSCFSVLPISFHMMTPELPHSRMSSELTVIYFPPALAQWQRPPIASLFI